MAEEAARLAPGARVGRYELLEELGRGGMGVVFKARDPSIGRFVAIKTLRLDFLDGAVDRAGASTRFAREAQAVGRLSHPHIVTLYDAQQEGGLAYLVMEFVAGKSLESLLRAGTKFSVDRVCSIGSQVCDALELAHANGVVHRDIKPANILLQENGQAKVTDFGVAYLASSTLTRTGHQLGTPSYMSPEQVEGKPVDGRSDVFSLGSVLYELICNEKAFPGETITTIIYRILHADPAPLHQLNKVYPPELDAAIRKALAKDPAARYARASEFRDTLSRLAAGVAGPAPRPAAAEGTVTAGPAAVESPTRRRGPRTLLIGGGVAASAILLAIILYSRPSGPRPAVREEGPAAAPASTAGAKEGPAPGHAGETRPASTPPAQEGAPSEARIPKAMRVAFARDVKGVLPVEEGETFYRDDRKVVLWVRWANVRGRHAMLARWFDPEGNLAYASPTPEPFESPAEWWTTWTTLDLGRFERARPGHWRVELQLDGRPLATAHFALVDQPRPPPPASPPPPGR
jgi:serine/threonine-protein kinase